MEEADPRSSVLLRDRRSRSRRRSSRRCRCRRGASAISASRRYRA